MADSAPPRKIWGCLVACLFFFLLGIPILAAMTMGECFGDPVDCRNKQLDVIKTAAAVLVITLFLFWLTNFLVARRNRNRP